MFRLVGMEYRCVATSVAGFVQQLVSCYLPHGYWFYVSGSSRKTRIRGRWIESCWPSTGSAFHGSRGQDARRWGSPMSTISAINAGSCCWQPTDIIRFSMKKHKNIRDARRVPIKFAGYSISVAQGGFKAKKFNERGPGPG